MTPKPKPRYVVIAEALERRIIDGVYPPGATIPSYRDLMAGAAGTDPVSWATVSSAVALLASRGLVDQPASTSPGERGGTRVRIRREAIQASQGYVGAKATSWREAMAAHGLAGDQIVVRAGRQQAPPEITNRLELEPGSDAVVRQRIMLGDDWPYQLATGWYPVHIAAGTLLEQPQRMPLNATQMLEKLGHRPVRLREEVRARPATEDEAAVLRMREGTPVLLILRTCSTATTPVEVAEIVCAGNLMSCRWELPL